MVHIEYTCYSQRTVRETETTLTFSPRKYNKVQLRSYAIGLGFQMAGFFLLLLLKKAPSCDEEGLLTTIILNVTVEYINHENNEAKKERIIFEFFCVTKYNDHHQA